MPGSRPISVKPIVGYLLAPPLVALTSWALLLIQQYVQYVTEDSYSRPYGIGFLFPVAVITALAGAIPGLWTLALSMASTVYVLTAPRFSWEIQRPGEWAEILSLVVVGSLVIFSLDATRRARQRSDELLAESEEARARLRTVMDTAPVAVLTCAPDGTLDYANREAERIWGQPLQKVGREGWGQYRLLYPDGTPVPPERMGLARALSGEAPIISQDVVIERPDSTRIWVQASSTRISDESGRVLGGMSVFSDITERKRAEEALQKQARVLESMAEGVSLSDENGIILYTNPAEDAMFGYEPGELIGKHVAVQNTYPPEENARVVAEVIQQLKAQGAWHGEFSNRKKDGTPFITSARITALELSGRQYWVCVQDDITERKQAEAERARLLVEVQGRAEREALLNRIGQAQRGSLDPAAVQVAAVEALGLALDADRCYFATYDIPQDRAWVTRDWHRADLPSLAGEYRLSEFDIDFEKMYGSGASQVVEDVRTDPGIAAIAPVLEALRLRSGVSVPLFEDGQLVAVLSVAMADGPRAWTPDEVALVEAVAAQTHSTMNTARLLQRERNIAEQLQNALTPSLPGPVPGLDIAPYYKAALEEAIVGGDFLDVFSIDKGCTALVVGDLSGKGLKAASQVATVRNMLRYALYQGRTVAEAVGSLNDVFAEHDLLSGFVTLFVGLYDTGTGTLTYISCGHEPALLRRAKTGVVEELTPTGAVLGAFPQATYQQQTVSLSPGDTLALYTDGLSEAGRGRHDFLGVAGLAGLLRQQKDAEPAAEVVDRIVAGVKAHAHDDLHDDICLLVAVVEGKN